MEGFLKGKLSCTLVVILSDSCFGNYGFDYLRAVNNIHYIVWFRYHKYICTFSFHLISLCKGIPHWCDQLPYKLCQEKYKLYYSWDSTLLSYT